ncbi:MAG: hypothetical protein ACPW61_08710 [Methyloligella sp. ZOD6]
MSFRPFAFAAVLLATVCSGGPAADAASYGLAIGIDAYDDGKLAGAVADAKDIAAGLEAAGAAKVDLLTNAAAGREAVEAAWSDLLGQARYGDTIVLSFAGKGETDKNDPGEGGPQYRLGDGTALPRQTILDWARAADEKGVKLLFIGDASFAGGLERNYPKDLVVLRQSTEKAGESSEPGARPENGFGKATFVYGAPIDKAVPELTIGDTLRGGLSWAFGRALSGAGVDLDRDGMLSDRELATYLPLAVGALTQGQQEVQVLPRRSSPVALLRAAPGGDESPAEGALRLAVMGGEAAVIGAFPDVEIVDDPKQAELLWSVEDEMLTHRIGGVVASDIDAEGLENALAKWSALDWLVSRSALSPVAIDLVSGPGRLLQGARAQLEILPGRYPMLTVFDLAPDGRVVPIMPGSPEMADKPQNRRHIHQMFQVGDGPDGALHRVVIFSDKPLTGLHRALAEMQETGKTQPLLTALKDALPPDAQAQIGIFPIYTGPGDSSPAE